MFKIQFNCFITTSASLLARRFLVEDFKSHDINIDHCIYHEGLSCPLSVVILNVENGSRTILHTNK